MFARRWLLAAAVCGLLAAGPAPAHAQNDTDELISLLTTQPDGMEASAWKERRREAAIELGRRKEPSAVPALIAVIQDEEFDIVVEHAIDALGAIGDPSAKDVLNEVAADPDRDADARARARAALKALGESASVTPVGPSKNAPPTPTDLGRASAIDPEGRSARSVNGPSFADDAISVSERLVVALGDASLSYDTIRETPSFSGSVRGEYLRLEEREKMGLDYGAELAAAGGGVNAPGPGGSSQSLVAGVGAHAEARLYLGGKPMFALAGADLRSSLTFIRVTRAGADNTRETRLGIDAALRVGGGYGRVLERGQALRVARIEIALRRAKLLGRPIGGDLAEQLQRAWWRSRGDISTHRQLLATIDILRDAGVLLDVPSADATYKILQILDDGRLSSRPDGFAVALGISETFLVRDDDLDLEDGRIENVFARARFAKQQANGEAELIGAAAARYRILADDDEQSPWLALATVALRKSFYNDTFDSLGSIEFAGEAGISDDGDDINSATRVGGSVGWIFTMSRFSQVRAAVSASLESSELFVGATLSGSYGFLDVSFLGKSAY